MVEYFREVLKDREFYVGLFSFLAIFLLPFLTRRRKKLFFDVVHAATLPDQQSDAMEAEGTETGEQDGLVHRAMFVIEVQNAVGSLFGGAVGGTDITPRCTSTTSPSALGRTPASWRRLSLSTNLATLAQAFVSGTRKEAGQR